jgi:hypothetical protein
MNWLTLFHRKSVTPRDESGRYVSDHRRKVRSTAAQMYREQGRDVPEVLLP